MPWYAAHVVQYMQFLDGDQDIYPLYENVILIEADDSDAAYEKANQIAYESYDHKGGDTGGLRYGERPATFVFAGIRKLIACQDTVSIINDRPAGEANSQPRHGTEITYSFLEIASADEFKKYVAGDAAVVTYDE